MHFFVVLLACKSVDQSMFYMLCENKIRYTLLFSLLLLINNNKIFKKQKSNKMLDYIFRMLSIKNMTIWKRQAATDQVQQEDQAVVSASTMTAVKTVMTKIAAQNLHAPENSDI
jgi:hypothetical protein